MQRAESLASGRFRRDKFWPKRYRCEQGILEVLDDLQIFEKESDDFPDRKSDLAISDEESSGNVTRLSFFLSEQDSDSPQLNANAKKIALRPQL